MRSDSIKKAKDGVSGGVFYLGLAVIGVLAIPGGSPAGTDRGRVDADGQADGVFTEKH